MYGLTYEQVLQKPDSPAKRFIIQFMNTPKPDFTKLDKEVEEFLEELRAEREAEHKANEETARKWCSYPSLNAKTSTQSCRKQ